MEIKALLILVALCFFSGCSSGKDTAQKVPQDTAQKVTQDMTQKAAQETAPKQTKEVEGFLGIPWGTDIREVSREFSLNAGDSGLWGVRYEVSLDEYDSIPIMNCSFIFRQGEFSGVGFQLLGDESTEQLLKKVTAEFGDPFVEYSTAGQPVPSHPADTVGGEISYRWESDESFVRLIAVKGGISTAFILKRGENKPQAG